MFSAQFTYPQAEVVVKSLREAAGNHNSSIRYYKGNIQEKANAPFEFCEPDDKYTWTNLRQHVADLDNINDVLALFGVDYIPEDGAPDFKPKLETVEDES